MLLKCGVGEDSWESLGLQGDPTSPSQRRSVLGVHWKDWCWSWNSNTLATWCEELTHWKWGMSWLIPTWCWERLRAGGEGDDRGWDGWMASSIQWTWVWVDSGSWWWTGRPGLLQFMGSQRVGLNWTSQHSEMCISMHACILSCFNSVQLFATPWTVAYQASLSMGSFGQENWSGLPCLLQGIFPTQESNPSFLHWQWFFTTSTTQASLCLSRDGKSNKCRALSC